MKQLTREEIEVASMVASRYRRSFRGDLDDYTQEAMLAIIRARATFDAERGSSWRGYAWSAACRALWGYASQTRAPVHACTHKAAELSALRTVEISEVEVEDRKPTPEFCVDDRMWHAAVSRRIVSVIQQLPHQRVISEVIIDGCTMADTARKYGAPDHKVKRWCGNARSALRDDPELRSLFESRLD